MMANANRTVLERISEFDASNAAPSSSSSSPSSHSFRSLAISYDSESQKTLVYVGTDVATLILLSSNTNISTSDTKGHGLSFTRSTPIPIPISSSSSSSSSVDSIHAFEEIGRVIVLLSDGFVFSLDSHLLQPPTRLTFPRGVTVVAPRSRSRSRSRSRPSSSAMGNCVAAVAVGKRLILIELLLSNAQFLVLKEIQGIEGVKAMVWIDDSIIVATVAGYTQCSLVSGGQFTPIFNLPDPSSPPYLKCLPRDHQALLLIDNVGILVNRLGHPVGGSFIFRCVPDAAGDIASYLILVGDGAMDLYHKKTGCCVQSVSFAGKGIGLCTLATMEPAGHAEIVVAATASKIICFRKVSAEEQIKDLLRKKNFKEAITLVEELENEGELTRDMLSFVHAQVGFLLLFDMHFEEAINHFLLSETMQPSEIFPFIMRDPNRWSTLVPRNRYWGLHPPPVPLEDVIDEGMMTIQRAVFLRKAGVETSVDEEFIKNPPTRAYLLESAIKNVIRYLQVSRNKDLAPSVKEGVDTFLMYLYRVLNYVDEMEQLASSENSCVVEELETLLDGSGHLRTLAFLYASKGMSSKALAIWRILPRNYSVGLWKDPAIDDDDSLKNFISSQKVAATEASKLLEDSSDQDLVLQHLGWIADVDQALAIQILTSEKRTNQLSPEEVIGAIGSKKVDILQRYLQWLIEDQDSDDSQFHTLYALSLAKSALESVDNNVNLEKPDASARSRKKDISDSEEECATFRSTVRERLQLFLQSSDLYDPEEVLDLVEGSELWLEKAILYRKLGQEMLVLQILALKLEDSEAAEQYCAEIGRPDAYMQLLDMYLDPQNGKEPMFNAAVRLLHNHGESLDPRQVLETLSPDMPLQLAADTILRMLRARVHHRCQCQIAHNLSRAINIDARLARLEERSRHVQINDESVCDSCHARLGTKLFAMYPDDAIVCYKCFRRLGESTSVSGRNFKRDIIFKPGWLVNH